MSPEKRIMGDYLLRGPEAPYLLCLKDHTFIERGIRYRHTNVIHKVSGIPNTIKYIMACFYSHTTLKNFLSHFLKEDRRSISRYCCPRFSSILCYCVNIHGSTEAIRYISNYLI